MQIQKQKPDYDFHFLFHSTLQMFLGAAVSPSDLTTNEAAIWGAGIWLCKGRFFTTDLLDDGDR